MMDFGFNMTAHRFTSTCPSLGSAAGFIIERWTSSLISRTIHYLATRSGSWKPILNKICLLWLHAGSLRFTKLFSNVIFIGGVFPKRVFAKVAAARGWKYRSCKSSFIYIAREDLCHYYRLDVPPIFLSARHLPKMKTSDKKLCSLKYPSGLTELGLHLGKDAGSLEISAQTETVSSV